MQPQLVNLRGHANPDQIFQTIGQIGGAIGQIAQTGQGIDHIFHPNGDPKADQAFGTMSQASGMIQQGAQTGSNIYHIFHPQGLQNLSFFNLKKIEETGKDLYPLAKEVTKDGIEWYTKSHDSTHQFTLEEKLAFLMEKGVPVAKMTIEDALKVWHLWHDQPQQAQVAAAQPVQIMLI